MPRILPLTFILLFSLFLTACQSTPTAEPPPNIIVIITDDQGYGDFGFHGNPVLQTPHLDAMAEGSARLENFYVSPVCAPTRASLMTGRYNYRTRVVDTWLGRAMMEPDEITIAEQLQANGYATGIFGKWHLGDNYPMRPMDQGFQESLIHRGGGIGQPADPIGAEGKYTDPTLLRNGELTPMEGYCTNLYFEHALDWIEEVHEDRPFFAYIPTNAPHGPYHDVPDSLYQYYKGLNLRHELFPMDEGYPFTDDMNADRVARIFAMIANVDENIGRLFQGLDQMDITDNTLVIFMNDNGPNSRRYVNGMRGMKTSVYEGGVRSPFFAHWPAGLEPGLASDHITAHIDVVPTLLDAAGISPDPHSGLDGQSVLPLLNRTAEAWPDRTLFIQAHRGDNPVRYHHFMARNQRWKLVHHSGFGRQNFEGDPNFELFDMENDPFEMNNLADQHPDTLNMLLTAYDTWFDEVGSTRPDNYAPPRIVIDPAEENPMVLTRQDWRHTPGYGDWGWAPDALGYWLLDVDAPGTYAFSWRFTGDDVPGIGRLMLNGVPYEQPIPAGTETLVFENIEVPEGPLKLEAELTFNATTRGIYQMEIASTSPGTSP